MGSLKSSCRTFYRSSIETIAPDCLVFEKNAFCVRILVTDRQTSGRTDEQMDKPSALSRLCYRERRFNNVHFVIIMHGFVTSEAEYTFRLRKRIIPLRLQPGYLPDGWLGALAGSKLVFDCSLPSNLEEAVRNVIRELGNVGKVGAAADSKSEVLVFLPLCHWQSLWCYETTAMHVSGDSKKYPLKVFQIFSRMVGLCKWYIAQLLPNRIPKYLLNFGPLTCIYLRTTCTSLKVQCSSTLSISTIQFSLFSETTWSHPHDITS